VQLKAASEMLMKLTQVERERGKEGERERERGKEGV